MAIFICKMCGAQLSISENEKTCTCDYCDSVQTLPLLNNEKKINLFNRANRLRSKCEFDVAEPIFQNLVSEFPDESEAYWGICLCKFGIEYVEDPLTGNRVPTCHRTCYESIFDDPDYRLAIANCDAVSRSIYENEAKNIHAIQKKILDIVKNEQPYDVFICYKERDENKERTKDSVLAEEIYDKLTDRGFKVFFSLVTLDGKPGIEYEPYIFAALQSAKVMLLVTSSLEYVNAVWVKNEWSRFARLMATDKDRTLIPCYTDIDPEDLPDMLNNRQATNMSKIGAIQDLVRGVGKLLKKDDPVIVEHVDVREGNFDSLLRRAHLYLDDADWDKADEYAERTLDIDPECAEAYKIKLMVEKKISGKDKLSEYRGVLEDSKNYKKIIQFGDKTQVDEIKALNLDSKLNKLKWRMRNIDLINTNTVNEYLDVLSRFTRLFYEYEESAELSQRLKEKVREIKYSDFVHKAEETNSSYVLGELIKLLTEIKGYKDSANKLEQFNEKLLEIKYSELVKKSEETSSIEELENIVKLFAKLDGYKYSDEMIQQCKEKIKETKYHNVIDLFNNASSRKEFELVAGLFESMRDYKDSEDYIEKCQMGVYDIECKEIMKIVQANYRYISGMEHQAYTNRLNGIDEIAKKFEALSTTNPFAAEYIKKCEYEKKKLMYSFATQIYYQIDSNPYMLEIELKIQEIISIFTELGSFANSQTMLKKCESLKEHIDKDLKKKNLKNSFHDLVVTISNILLFIAYIGGIILIHSAIISGKPLSNLIILGVVFYFVTGLLAGISDSILVNCLSVTVSIYLIISYWTGKIDNISTMMNSEAVSQAYVLYIIINFVCGIPLFMLAKAIGNKIELWFY